MPEASLPLGECSPNTTDIYGGARSEQAKADHWTTQAREREQARDRERRMSTKDCRQQYQRGWTCRYCQFLNRP